MTYLWGSKQTSVDERVMHFLAGEDVILDRQLMHYDIQATAAHVDGLARIGLLDESERCLLNDALTELSEHFEDGRFVLDERFEDGHSAIETWLVERVGAVGEKVHTGRSRNDQVLVAIRLFMRDALTDLLGSCRATAEACLTQARDYERCPMPGYTHLQRAVVSSVGTWFAAFAESFIDNAALAIATRDWVDANPLGTAAGYGVNLPLDREFTTAALGFGRMQINPIYAQNSRGKFELQALSSLSQALLDVRRYAWDLSLFTSSEFGFVTLPDKFTTGSSIMPNKRNPDLVELLRAAHATVQGAVAEMNAVLSLPSGYQRDLQITKGPLLRAFARGLEAMACMPSLVQNTTFDEQKLRAAIEPSMYATDRALEQAREGVPFRQAYRDAKSAGTDQNEGSPDTSVSERVSPGAAGNLLLPTLEDRLRNLPL